MKVFIHVVILLLLIMLPIGAYTQSVHFSADERTIIELQDRRTGTDEIAKYLASPQAKTAWRAAVALANIGDSTSRAPLLKQLKKEKRPYVNDAIAFALGILSSSWQLNKMIRRLGIMQIKTRIIER